MASWRSRSGRNVHFRTHLGVRFNFHHFIAARGRNEMMKVESDPKVCLKRTKRRNGTALLIAQRKANGETALRHRSPRWRPLWAGDADTADGTWKVRPATSRSFLCERPQDRFEIGVPGQFTKKSPAGCAMMGQGPSARICARGTRSAPRNLGDLRRSAVSPLPPFSPLRRFALLRQSTIKA